MRCSLGVPRTRGGEFVNGAPSPSGEGKGVGPVGVAQTYMPHPNPVEPLGPVRGTGPSTPEGEGLNFAIF